MPILTCPADFRDHAPSKTNRQLAERYGVGEKTITRWRVQYVVGTQLLSDYEVVSLAEEKGFQPYNRLFDLAS